MHTREKSRKKNRIPQLFWAWSWVSTTIYVKNWTPGLGPISVQIFIRHVLILSVCMSMSTRMRIKGSSASRDLWRSTFNVWVSKDWIVMRLMVPHTWPIRPERVYRRSKCPGMIPLGTLDEFWIRTCCQQTISMEKARISSRVVSRKQIPEHEWLEILRRSRPCRNRNTCMADRSSQFSIFNAHHDYVT